MTVRAVRRAARVLLLGDLQSWQPHGLRIGQTCVTDWWLQQVCPIRLRNTCISAVS